MENDIPVRMLRNIGPRKMETKIKAGPVLHRPALGAIHNKPSLHSNLDGKKSQANILKKVKTEKVVGISSNKSVLPKSKINSGKENIPTKLPSVKEDEVHDESPMDVDEVAVEELSVAFSSNMLGIKDIDEEDAKNPQLASAYVKDIYKYLWELEECSIVKVNYLEGMKVSSRMRAILIDWLVQVHIRFNLIQESLYLTVAILDRFLQACRTMTKDELQLVGVTSMLIACKYEEMYLPEINDFAYVTDKAFSKKDIRRMEVLMLNTLDFRVSFPLPLHFLRRNSKAGHVDSVHHTLAKYLMELTLPEYSFSHYKASMLAAAALYLALHVVDDGTKWDTVMTHYSNYSEKEILPLVYKLSALVIRSSASKQQAIRSKYKSSKFMRISDIAELKPTSRILKNFAEKASLT